MGDRNNQIIQPSTNRSQVPILRLPNGILRNSRRASRRRSLRRRRSARSNSIANPTRLRSALQRYVRNDTKYYKEKDYGPYTSQTKIQSSESKHAQAGKTKKKAKRKKKKRTKGRNKRRKNSYKRKRKK